MGRALLALVLMCCCAAGATGQPLVQGLDHIPIAVRDLETAGSAFQALGFALKPGRSHANGLRNLHAKFPDGTELELITATTAVDPLSSTYVEWLKDGEGPMLLGLYAPDARAIARRLAEMNRAVPRPLFFDQRQKSSTDRPEHFAHANSAFRLRAAWLAGGPAESLLRALPAGVEESTSSCAPFGRSDRTLRLLDGEIVLLPPTAGRPIVAATVSVRSLDAVRRVAARAAEGCGRGSLWVQTHGLWLEFREP